MLQSFIITQVKFFTQIMGDLYTDLYTEGSLEDAKQIKNDHLVCKQLVKLIQNKNFKLTQLNTQQIQMLNYIISEWAIIQNTTCYTVSELQQLQTFSNNIKTLL